MDLELKNVERSEEIQVIVEKIPTKTGYVVTCLVIALVAVFLYFGFTIRYPDIVSGEIVINANLSPVRLISNSSGKMILFQNKSQVQVSEGDYIAAIQNSASIDDVVKIKRILTQHEKHKTYKVSDFPTDIALGELNVKYFTFLNSLQQLDNFKGENLYDKRSAALNNLLLKSEENAATLAEKLTLSSKNIELIRKFIKRDSILYSRKIITEAEHDQSSINLISGKEAHQNIMSDLINSRLEAEKIIKEIGENSLQKVDMDKQLILNFISALKDLQENIKIWEDRYVFIAPISGKVQFSQFWNNNQYITSGQHVFTIVPTKTETIGQMQLPSKGAGKVTIGQETIIKLENYPYAEFGSIKGKVSSIALTSNTISTNQGALDTYLINVELPEGLKTNYQINLDFKYEIKGTCDIVTNDRLLLERLFDDMKYHVKR